MHVQTNTDDNIEGSAGLADYVSGLIQSTLSRFEEQITRVEVHLSDENAQKGGVNDKRCLMEARLKGRLPTAVTHQASTVDEAVQGAADKLLRHLESTLGRARGLS